MTTLHDALLERRAIAERALEQYAEWEARPNVRPASQRLWYPDDDRALILLLDVAIASENMRIAWSAFRDGNAPHLSEAERDAFVRVRESDEALLTALDRLRTHLCGGEDGA